MALCYATRPSLMTFVSALNQEKALLGAFSVITNLRMDLFWSTNSLRVWYPAQPDPTHIKDTSRDASDMNIGVWLLAIYYLLSRPDIYPTLPKYSVRLLRPWNQVHIEYEVMAQPQYRLNKLRSEQKTQWTDIRHDRAILLCSPHHNI